MAETQADTLFDQDQELAMAPMDVYAPDYFGVKDVIICSPTFAPGAIAGQISCVECDGTGWWGYGPTPAECGPCVPCKGTGRVWVGLR